MHKITLVVLSFLFLIVTPSASFADHWDPQPDKSVLEFQVQASGSDIKGGFDLWLADIQFDATDPKNGKVRVEVDMTSVTIGSPASVSTVSSPDWLDSAGFPKALFEGSGFDFGDDENFTLTGMLTLKNIEAPLTLTGQMQIHDDIMSVAVTGIIKRDLYAIGTGQTTVSSTVQISAIVIAKRRH